MSDDRKNTPARGGLNLPNLPRLGAPLPRPTTSSGLPALPRLHPPAASPPHDPHGLSDDSDEDIHTSVIALDALAPEPALGGHEVTELEPEDVSALVEDDDPPTVELTPEDVEDIKALDEPDPAAAAARAQTERSALLEVALPEHLDEAMDAESTTLFDSHTELSLSSPFSPTPMSDEPLVRTDLDDYEEGGATIVFDSMSGKKLSDLAPASPSLILPKPLPLAAPAEPSPQPSPGFDEFAALRTELLQRPFEREVRAPKLRFVSGPMANQEVFVTGLRATLGRGEHNSIMVADASMSRHHFEIVKNPDESYTLRDLGSSNGTLLNNHPVREAALFHGDRIEAGKSQLQFDCPDAPPKPHRHLIAAPVDTLRGAAPLDEKTSLAAFQLDQSTRQFTRVSIGAAIICVPLIAALIALSLRPPAPAASTPVHAQAQPAIPIHKAKAATLYLEGVEALKVRDWALAEAEFKRAQVMDESLQVGPQLDLIARERQAQLALEQAQTLLKRERFEEVHALVDTIPPQSVYFAQAQQLRRQQRLDDVNELLKQAQAHLTADALTDAQTSIAAILKLSPQHEGALELQRSVLARQEALAKKARDEELAQADAKNPKLEIDPFGASARKTPAQDAQAALPSTLDPATLQEALTMHKRGKHDQAIRLLEPVKHARASKLVAQLKLFKTHYPQAKEALASKNWPKAKGALEKARDADAKISGAFKAELAADLAQLHGELGLTHLRARRFKEARAELVAGQRAGAKHPRLNELERELEAEATKLYIQAANKKKSDPDSAQQLCRQILLMVPSSSPTSVKARNLLTEL